MPVLHMETDLVRGTGNQLQQASASLQQQTQQLNYAVQSLTNAWQGPSASIFMAEIQPLLQHLNQFANNGELLNQRLQREVAEWEQVNQAGVHSYAQWRSDIAGVVALNKSWVDSLKERWETNRAYEKVEKDFNHSWGKMSFKDRKDYLQAEYDRLIREYGLEPVKITIEDLPDSFLKDAKGVYRGEDIAIDIDNINSKNGFDVYQTLVHETRHQIQAEAVARYLADGDNAELPKGISIEQAQEWSENFDNYIRPEDNFKGYRQQPVEQDARDFAKDRVIKSANNKRGGGGAW